jgi:hypothetical protein
MPQTNDSHRRAACPRALRHEGDDCVPCRARRTRNARGLSRSARVRFPRAQFLAHSFPSGGLASAGRQLIEWLPVPPNCRLRYPNRRIRCDHNFSGALIAREISSGRGYFQADQSIFRPLPPFDHADPHAGLVRAFLEDVECRFHRRLPFSPLRAAYAEFEAARVLECCNVVNACTSKSN